MRLKWNPPKIDRQRAIHGWMADYAADVHNGQEFRDGARSPLPARPWTELVLNENNVAEMVATHYRDGRSLNQAFISANGDLGQKFDEAIEAEIWDWPRAPSPRDIVDTGELERSRVLSFS